jgi:hypothetical protein
MAESKFKKFVPTAKVQEDGGQKESKPFIQDESDNKLFPEIQVKDITSIITDDCVGAWDFDGVVYKACSNMENRLIKVVSTKHKIEEILPNITIFKGRGKNISETSWLGLQNIEREVKGEELYKVEDFEVIPFQELKMDKEKALEQVKIQILLKIKQVKQQYRIPKVKLLIGGGSNFRNNLNQVKGYKSGRDDTLRPLLLKDIREWVLTELDSEYADPLPDGTRIEADDKSNFYGVLGYKNYKTTGKFDFLEISTDKDALAQSGKLLVNPDTYVGDNNPLKGKFKFPQAMLIHTTDKCCGDVELVIKGGDKTTTKELKGFGFKYLMFQAILGKDQADSYNCLGDLGISLGDVEAYKILKPLKSAREVLQKCLDVAYEKLQYGVNYVSHKGEVLDVDTLTYLNEYFRTCYMLRHEKDTLTLFDLCKAMKVDTSKIVNNNLYTPPKSVYVGNEDNIKEVEAVIKEILTDKLKSFKQLKKQDAAGRIDEIKALLESINFDSHYEMQQQLKSELKEE